MKPIISDFSNTYVSCFLPDIISEESLIQKNTAKRKTLEIRFIMKVAKVSSAKIV